MKNHFLLYNFINMAKFFYLYKINKLENQFLSLQILPILVKNHLFYINIIYY